MNKIDKKLLQGINPLVEFLGAERVEDLKDKVAQMILDKVAEDLDEVISRDYLIDEEYINEITTEALAEVKEAMKKKLEAEYMAIAAKAISKICIKEV